jgi:hypothetical protein
VTGATTKSESYVEPLERLPSCADLAQSGVGSPATWSVPQGQDQTFYISWNITPYMGPGTYTDPSAFLDSVDIYTSTGQYSPSKTSPGTLSITVNADGSGTATFENVPNFNRDPAPSISGKLTWTCT